MFTPWSLLTNDNGLLLDYIKQLVHDRLFCLPVANQSWAALLLMYWSGRDRSSGKSIMEILLINAEENSEWTFSYNYDFSQVREMQYHVSAYE